MNIENAHIQYSIKKINNNTIALSENISNTVIKHEPICKQQKANKQTMNAS